MKILGILYIVVVCKIGSECTIDFANEVCGWKRTGLLTAVEEKKREEKRGSKARELKV